MTVRHDVADDTSSEDLAESPDRMRVYRMNRQVARMIPVASALVEAVHDQDADAVAAVIGAATSHGSDRRDTLLVVLAAMVDPRLSPQEALRWCDGETPARSVLADRHEWDARIAAHLHARFVAGERGPLVEAGEREFRNRARAARLAWQERVDRSDLRAPTGVAA